MGNRCKRQNLYVFLRSQVNSFSFKRSSASTQSTSSEVIHPNDLSYRPLTYRPLSYRKVRRKPPFSPKEKGSENVSFKLLSSRCLNVTVCPIRSWCWQDRKDRHHLVTQTDIPSKWVRKHGWIMHTPGSVFRPVA